MKKIVLIIISIAFSCNVFGQRSTKNDTIIIPGTIIKEKFVHGKIIEGVYDYWFRTNDKKYFIKEYGSAFTKDSLDKWVSKPIRITAVIKDGLWDTTNDPNMQQSRVGEYITILKIESVVVHDILVH